MTIHRSLVRNYFRPSTKGLKPNDAYGPLYEFHVAKWPGEPVRDGNGDGGLGKRPAPGDREGRHYAVTSADWIVGEVWRGVPNFSRREIDL